MLIALLFIEELLIWRFIGKIPAKEAREEEVVAEMPEAPTIHPPAARPTVEAARSPDNEFDLDNFDQLSLGNAFQLDDLEERFILLKHCTGFFKDGRKRIIADFLVRSVHKDNFRVTVGESGTSFCLQSKLSPSFLNALGRAKHEFDPLDHNTFVLTASIRL